MGEWINEKNFQKYTYQHPTLVIIYEDNQIQLIELVEIWLPKCIDQRQVVKEGLFH